MRTTVRLPDDLLDRAKRKARREGTTLTALLEQGLRSVLVRPAERPAKSIYPRISTARGGFLPDIDPIKTPLQEEAIAEGLPIDKQR